MMDYVISTDTGGTFVDAVIVDSNGILAVGKHSSTPKEPARGILGAAAAAARNFDLSLSDALSRCKLFFNGTTVTTNAMIQGIGANTGLLITRGFEDTLLIGRIKARTAGLDEREVTNYQHAERPRPIVPISLTRGVRERVDYQGKVLCPMDDAEVVELLDELVERGIEALAICLLWSFKNPTHEQRIKHLAMERHPRLFVTASSDLVPLMREYERANTTAINSFLGPTLDHYLRDIEAALRRERYDKDLLLMQSVGGLSPASEIRQTPITTLLSGPVGGAVATQQLGALIGEMNLISTDMGGTSFDVGMVVDGAPLSTPITVMQRQLVMFPCVDIVTIGAGGGSRIWLDDAMTLKVGPMSQGSTPGPACYGRGGTEPTVTDADVVLGYINPEHFLGGEMALDFAKARDSLVRRICDPLGLDLEEAAWGAYQIVNAHMADLVRQASVERGYDPREFVLVAFGGCGPTHCTGYGPDIAAKSIVVPLTAPVFSALGIAQSDVKHFYSRSLLIRLSRDEGIDDRDLASLQGVLAELIERARRQFANEGVDPKAVILRPSVDMRYRGQVHELVVPIGADGSGVSLDRSRRSFATQYEMLYGSGSSSELSDIEIVTVRVDALTPTLAKATSIYAAATKSNNEPIGQRRVFWGLADRWQMTPIYRGDDMGPDSSVKGPAVIEYYATTVPLHPGQSAHVDAYSNLIIRVEL
jgi:N-methylhydantoinase A